MVKAHDTVPRMNSGHHGGKKITGRGRHVAVDTEGWPLALVVTAASVSDKGGAKILLIRLFDAVAAVTVEVVARTSPHSFRVPRRRWVVERTFGWLMRYRRLARYDNGQPPSSGGAANDPAHRATGSKVVTFYGGRYPASGR